MLKLRLDSKRKYALITFAILICLGLIYQFLPFFQETVSPGEKIDLKEGRLIKYQKTVRAGRNLNDRLDALNTTLKQLESRLLTGKTPSLAAVEIQKILHEIAGKSNVQIGKVGILTPKELDRNYVRIPVEFHIIPTVGQLKEILYRIKSCPKSLTVTGLEIKQYALQSTEMRCRITVAGFMKRAQK